LEQFDAIAAYRLAYVQSLHGLALLKRETGDARRARELLDTAIGHLKEGMESAGDKQQRYQPFHGPLYVSLSRTLYDLDENELAQEAADLAQRIRPTPGGGPRYRFGHFGRPMPGHLMPGPMKPSPMMPSPMMPSPMMPDSRQPGPPGRRGRGPLVP